MSDLGVVLSDEQRLLASTVGRVVADNAPVALVPGARPAPADAAWGSLHEAGLLGLLAPTSLGGAGGSLLDAVVVVEQLARGPLAVGYLGTQLALVLALEVGDQATIDSIIGGAPVGIVLDDALRGLARSGVGIAIDAPVGASALALDGDRVVRATVCSSGVLDGVDLTRVLATGRGEAPVGQLIDFRAIERWTAIALTLVSADMVGAMAGALDLAVAHAKQREQFGHSIGSFQAVQHLCADALVSIESARHITRRAAAVLAAGPAMSEASLRVGARLARVAKAYVTEVGREVAEAAIQVLGGIGMTWESPAHLHLRRILLGRQLLGDDVRQHVWLAGELIHGGRSSAHDADELAVPDGIGDESRSIDEFRLAFRRWLAEHTPRGPMPLHGPLRAEHASLWHRSLYEGGWMGLSWPVEIGGRGLPALYEAVFNDEIGRAGAPPAPHVGFLGRALLHHGTPEQQRRFLPALLSGDEVWCQGFSEPDAGSDLAGLGTLARREGDDFVIDGQKVWTSDAAWADWCLLLVRTDPDAPRHKGISAVLVDMRSPGIEVRPITQINGDTEFNEVFFDAVRVPAANVLGAPGDGWRIAMTTVAYERGPTDIGFSSRYARLLRELVDGALGRALTPDQRIALARAHVHVEVLRAQVGHSLLARREDRAPGPEASLDKLLGTRVEQLLHHTATDLAGAAVVTGEAPAALSSYLYSRAASIAGGTSQIQKSIVAERLLGLPRSR